MRGFVSDIKERIMGKDEVLLRDGIQADYVYFFLSGKLRVEKEVDVSNVNYWP